MAASLSNALPQQAVSVGSLRAVVFDVVLATNEYLTDGIDFSAQLPYGTFVGAAVIDQSGAAYVPQVSRANKKLLLYRQDGSTGVLVQVANASSTAVTVRLLAFGF